MQSSMVDELTQVKSGPRLLTVDTTFCPKVLKACRKLKIDYDYNDEIINIAAVVDTDKKLITNVFGRTCQMPPALAHLHWREFTDLEIAEAKQLVEALES